MICWVSLPYCQNLRLEIEIESCDSLGIHPVLGGIRVRAVTDHRRTIAAATETGQCSAHTGAGTMRVNIGKTVVDDDLQKVIINFLLMLID